MKVRGTVTVDGITTETTGTFKFASLYRHPDGDHFFKFHRSEKAAITGTWDSPADLRGDWFYAGYAEITF